MTLTLIARNALLIAFTIACGHNALANELAAGSVVLWVQADGTVLAAGDNEQARGDDGNKPRRHFLPVAGLKKIKAVALAPEDDDSAAALDQDGVVWVWGDNWCASEASCTAGPHLPRQLALPIKCAKR